ncbi:DUF397 domain-containing protein [Nocardia mexicana]|uniref:Uncharacterized protein DUF397 n=1 Tax=Nocardia mexicana TaxID=279262 RepID=A0A370H2A6_9NOCA|nr:DUF397 domain-containing protein [Nocardia mexicana]RDI49967.1 uncharacterized protein DUF397 [Nocardia mexicana]
MTDSVDLPGAHWRKSSYSGGNSECVEVALMKDIVGVRDSKNPDGPTLAFTPTEWAAFTTGIRNNKYNNPPA